MTTGRDYLFAETMRALRLFPDDEEMRKDKDKTQHLNSFRSKGYFLVDTSPYPVDKMKQPKRDRTLIEQLPKLVKNVHEMNPEAIVIVKKNVFPIVRPALERLGFADRILNRKFLPFPSHGNQRNYRRRLRKLLSDRGFVDRLEERN